MRQSATFREKNGDEKSPIKYNNHHTLLEKERIVLEIIKSTNQPSHCFQHAGNV